MNKTFATAVSAALLASAGAAGAAEVQLFGFLDQGLSLVYEDLNSGMAAPRGQAKANVLNAGGKVARQGHQTSWAEGTGNVSTWGVKGAEKLNDDLSVIFHLESGFLPDTGEFYGSNTLFERESSLGLRSKSCGELKFGRMPSLTTGSGTTGIFNSKVNPFGAGWGNMTGGWKFVGTLAAARYNNMINYISPSMNGVRIHVQHSLGNSNDTTEGTTRTPRWTALGVTMTGERFYAAAAVDWLKKSNTKTVTSQSQAKDSWKAMMGGNYKFDGFQLFGTVQYLQNVTYIGGYSTKEFAPVLSATEANKGFTSWAFSTGVNVPLAQGTVKASVGYGFGKDKNLSGNNKFQRVNAGLGYVYPLSKRTSLYAIGGMFIQDADWQEKDIAARECIIGMMHRF